MIIIKEKIRALLAAHAAKVFPNECCGFLFGNESDGQQRTIREIMIVDNSKPGDKTRRFEISPLDYINAEKYALDNQLQLLGVYHSHPKHPAIPSEQDRIAAQPYFSYLIISIQNPETISFRSWRLNESEQFDEEMIRDNQLTKKIK